MHKGSRYGETLRQTVTFGADAGSAYSRLRKITSDVTPRLLAEVTATYGDGTVAVAYVGGGSGHRFLGQFIYFWRLSG